MKTTKSGILSTLTKLVTKMKDSKRIGDSMLIENSTLFLNSDKTDTLILSQTELSLRPRITEIHKSSDSICNTEPSNARDTLLLGLTLLT
jgi:hypothetical protein